MNYKVGAYISGFKKDKREVRNATWRLIAAFATVCAVIAMVGYVGIQFASASGSFGPIH